MRWSQRTLMRCNPSQHRCRLREFPCHVSSCRVLQPLQGAVIIRQGDMGDFFYVVESGKCDIFVEGVGKVRSA